jgi:hypothetical protein
MNLRESTNEAILRAAPGLAWPLSVQAGSHWDRAKFVRIGRRLAERGGGWQDRAAVDRIGRQLAG